MTDSETDVYTHSLTLQFGRTLSQQEWREVIEAARKLPYVKGLRADATKQEEHHAQQEK
jgi:hypothetical protein